MVIQQVVVPSAKVQKVGKGLGWPFQGKDGPFQGKVMTIQGVGQPIQGLTRHQLHYLRLKLLLMTQCSYGATSSVLFADWEPAPR